MRLSAVCTQETVIHSTYCFKLSLSISEHCVFSRGGKEKEREGSVPVDSVTCEGQFFVCPSYLFIWRTHWVSPGQMDHGKMNGLALRFITFIQTHQPVYLQSLTSTHLEIVLCFSFLFHLVSQHISTELIRFFLPSLNFTFAVSKS